MNDEAMKRWAAEREAPEGWLLSVCWKLTDAEPKQAECAVMELHRTRATASDPECCVPDRPVTYRALGKEAILRGVDNINHPALARAWDELVFWAQAH